MNFYSFYGYAAFLFGFGLMEEGPMYLFYVKSVKCKNYSEGNGIIGYLSPRNVVYLGGNYKDYADVMEKHENPRYHNDILTLHLFHVAERNRLGKSVKGGHAYSLVFIGSYTRCDRDDSLTMQHADEEVQITFSDAAGCEAFAKFLHDQNEFGYDIILED